MAYVQLRNQLNRRGYPPYLKMRLVACGDDKWPYPKGEKEPHYDIDKWKANFIPGSTESNKQWSSWNILDERGHYYGNITLQSDTSTGKAWTTPGFYKPPENNGRCSAWQKAPGSNLSYLVDPSLGPIDSHFFCVLSAREVYADVEFPFPGWPPARPAIRAYPRQPMVLRTEGASIVNDGGGKVILKGLNRPSLEWNPKGEYLGPLDIETMCNWGLGNVIRIPLNRNYWAASKAREEPGSYKQIVDAMIALAIHHDNAVILVNHAPQNLMPADDAIGFWKDVAATYRDFGTVLFDLHNECYDPERANHGKLKEPFEPAYLTEWQKGYQKLLDAVRDAGANNICLVGGLDYAYRLEFVNENFCIKDRPNGNGIVYRSHLYNGRGTDWVYKEDGLDGPGHGPPIPANGDRLPFDVNFAGVLGKFPVMITEFGCNMAAGYEPIIGCKGDPKKDPPPPGICTGGKIKPRVRDYYEKVIEWVNQNHFSYSAWGWWVNHCEPWFPPLIGNLTGDSINGGIVVRKDLLTNGVDRFTGRLET